MNKRQKKKASKKVVWPIVDEMNLLTLNKEEREKAIKDFEAFVQRHYRYKHYKDRSKLIRTPTVYFFPAGQATREFYKSIMRTARSYKPRKEEVLQAVSALKENYGVEKGFELIPMPSGTGENENTVIGEFPNKEEYDKALKFLSASTNVPMDSLRK